ncbi:MAG: LysR family transcriptional regulator [Myxococcota bacterium]
MDLNHLNTFATVVRLGSLSAAARAMGVPTSTVSRQLSRLERTLGVDLIHRGARRVSLTEAGAEVLARSQQPLRELQTLADGLSSGAPRGTLRISAPTNLAVTPWFASMLVRFRRIHPAVRLDIDCASWMHDPIEGGFDICFRPMKTIPDSPDLIARRLASADLRLYASAAYVARRGRPAHVHELAGYDMIAARMLHGQPMTLRFAETIVQVEPTVVAIGDDLSLVLSMVRAGAGYAVIPTPVVAEPLASGEIVDFLPGCSLPPLEPTMVWPRRRFEAPRVRAFIDFVIADLESAAPSSLLI